MTTTRPLRTTFRGGTLYDSEAKCFALMDVAVEDGRIVDVGNDLDGDEAVEVEGLTILPGLIDCHVHMLVSELNLWRLLETPLSYRILESGRNLAATLDAGITAVRDAGGADLGMKRAVSTGLVRGPRMQVAITMISQTGGHNDGWMLSDQSVETLFPIYPGSPAPIADGCEELRKKVREVIRAGADVIKVAASGGIMSARDSVDASHYRLDELKMIVMEAQAAGLGVMAHAHSADGIKNALGAGATSIEHGIFLDEEAVELLLETGAFLVPTLTAPEAVIQAAARGESIHEGVVREAREIMEIHRATFRKAVDAGVKIAMGSDAGISPHGENLRELAVMAEHGLSIEECLTAATLNGARALGWDEWLGSVAVGKKADLVLVESDFSDVANLSECVRAVYKDGELVGGQRWSAGSYLPAEGSQVTVSGEL